MLAEEFEEKSFYLDEFRAHALCFLVPWTECEKPGGIAALGGVLRDLMANDSRVIVLLGLPEGHGEVEPWLSRVRRRLQPAALCDDTLELFPRVRGRRSAAESFVDLTGSAEGADLDEAKLDLIWSVLRARPLLVGLVEPGRLLGAGWRLAVRLRVHKLVVVEGEGGIATGDGPPLSFMTEAMLAAVLREGEAEWTGLAPRRAMLESVRAALQGGVRAVNLCGIEELPRELFTYEGAGTLFTLEDYCRVERLGIDDFEEVERLIERGQREGYLKRRTPAEISRILFNGYGATIGSHHLAGVCGLETEPYASERAGEVVGLYTITRFKGEGVGARLLDQVVGDAQGLGLRYVFACTTAPRAQAFFERQQFRPVGAADVPAAKWVGYDEERRARLKIYRRDLRPAEPPR